VASHSGVLSVLDAGEAFQVLSRIAFEEPISATPAIVEGTLYVRTDNHLYAFAQKP
jgi:outer membrane protein assembly factor BamB